MSKHGLKTALVALIAVGFVSTAGFGALASTTSTNLECSPATPLDGLTAGAGACTETGTVVASSGELGGGSATFVLGVDRSGGPADNGRAVAGRGATFAGPVMKAYADAYNPTHANQFSYGIIGSSGGKRAFFGTMSSSDAATLTVENRVVGEYPVTGKPDACSSSQFTNPAGLPLDGSSVCAKWTMFGASEAPLSSADIGLLKNRYPGAIPLHFPFALGTVAVTYNVPGFGPGDIKLTGELVQRIYLGEITTWGHADLVALNPSLAGSTLGIVPVHRWDGSGTSFAYTDFFARSAPLGWKASEAFTSPNTGTATAPVCAKSGGSVPTGRTLAAATICANGNRGVAQSVQATTGALGYNELGTAVEFGLGYAAVRNADGTNFVLPSPQSGRDAAIGAEPRIPEASGNWSAVSIAWAPGDNSYPASTFTYIVAFANPAQVRNVQTGETLAGYYSSAEWAAFKHVLRWILTDGQALHESLFISAIDAETTAKNLRGVDQLTNYGPHVTVTVPSVDAQGFPLQFHRVNVAGTATSASAITSDAFGVHNAAYSTVNGATIASGAVNGRYVQVAATVSATLPDLAGGYTLLAIDGDGNAFNAYVPASVAGFAGVPDTGALATLAGQGMDGELLVRAFAIEVGVVPMPLAGL